VPSHHHAPATSATANVNRLTAFSIEARRPVASLGAATLRQFNQDYRQRWTLHLKVAISHSQRAEGTRRKSDPFDAQMSERLVAMHVTSTTGKAMSLLMRVLPAAMLAATLACSAVPALAQGDAKPADKPAAAGQPADAAKEAAQRQVDEFAEAARTVSGPAGNAECVWLGRRVVGLLTRDDLDTAFRHLDLYDRFGCPGPHIQSTFRCVVRQGPLDPKASQSLNARVHACWLNPGSSSHAAAAAPAAPAPAAGTAARAGGAGTQPR
jgi:hypothetical protein